MKTQTEKILNVLRIIAWIGYIGSLILLGTLLILGFFSFLEPNLFIKILVKTKINSVTLLQLREQYQFHYFCYLGLFIIGIFFIVKIWELAKITLSIISLKHPFTFEIAKTLERIAFYMFCIWILSIIGNIYNLYLEHLFSVNIRLSISLEFSYFFGAGLIYLISQIFKRGVELQEENELTV